MNRIIFYLPGETINDATEYYVDLVKKALISKNIPIVIHHNLDFESNQNDYVFLIRIKDFITVKRKFRKARIIMWFQGIDPEEFLMRNHKSLVTSLKFRVFNFLEKITLKKSYFNFFVSIRMQEHLRDKHSYLKNNFTIIPCYNKQLDEEYFQASIKPKSSFVYAGSLYSWQCFEQTLVLYKKIEENNSNAFLTILTKDIKEAEKQIKDIGINNYNVNYVSLNELDKELSKHKYGFMLREEHIVNCVATPTKMNTYLAVGLIPIYTDAIASFNENLHLEEFDIKINLNGDVEKVASMIIKHDNVDIDYKAFYRLCQSRFKEYYDDEYNINKIKTELIDKFLLVN